MEPLFEIVDEDNIPQELLDAKENNTPVYVDTEIGWVKCEYDYSVGNLYKIN